MNAKKFSDLAAVTLTGAILVVFGILFWALPDKAISEAENRTLEPRPELTRQSLLSGDFTSRMGKYFADQFPLRDKFVGLKAYAELSLLKGENNGVILADGHLIPNPPAVNSAQLERNLASISTFAEDVDIPVYTAALPRTVDVFENLLPAYYSGETAEKMWREYTELCGEYGLETVDLLEILRESGDYYRTDHHYTTDGAYLCYRQLSNTLGYTPFDEDYFTLQTVSDSFAGTSMRTSGFYLTEKDKITLYRFPGDEKFRVEADDGLTLDGFYDFDALDTTDKYAVFLGGNHARVDVTLPGETRPRLLLIRDSFADCIVPFLSLHYDITLLDLRYYKGNVQRLAAEGGYDAALVYQCISELDRKDSIFAYLELKYKKP